MERNDITAAPAVAISDSLYEDWHNDHHGSRDDFISFLMSPSVDRERFLQSHVSTIRQVGSVTVEAY